jgi:outer membrane immunogenic protein
MRCKLAILLAFTAGLGGAQTAYAADLPVKARPPAAVVAYSWTGFYIGGHGGIVRTHDTRVDDAGFILNDFHTSSWLAGGHAGVNIQFGQFVLGAEVSGSATDLHGSQLCPNPTFRCHIEHEYLFLAGGRAGFALDRALLYATGGYAQTNSRVSGTPFFAGFNSEVTNDGWYVGGGLEYAFDPGWVVGIEYIRAEFDGARYADPSLVNPPYTTSADMDIIRARLSYKFGFGFGWGR